MKRESSLEVFRGGELAEGGGEGGKLDGGLVLWW